MENLDSLFQNVTTSISVPAMLAILHILYPMLLGIYVEGKQVSDQEYRNYIFHISLAIQWIGIFSTFFIFRQLVKSKKYRTIGTIILFFTLQLP
jgi:ACR3 family arsenite efflux pump ArsB